MTFQCIKTGAHLHLWDGNYCVADAFDLGGCYMFQCMPISVEPQRGYLHFELATYEKTYPLSPDAWSNQLIIVRKSDCVNHGYDGKLIEVPVDPEDLRRADVDQELDYKEGLLP
jgi:hypothetical protein